MTTKKLYWFQIALQLKGSVIQSIYKRVLVCGLFGFFISILYYFKLPVSQPSLETVIPSIAFRSIVGFQNKYSL
jgi:putative membrane protein